MNGGVLIGFVQVPLFGALMWAGPLLTRPTVQFGVRVPPAHVTAPVIRRERRAYQWRTAVVVLCCTAAVIALGSHRNWWRDELVMLVQIGANLGCFWSAHRRIAEVKATEDWFAGQRQTVVADTSWRTRPQRFPIAWLMPAVAVVVATVIIGVLRYPHLPAHLENGNRRITKSPVSAFMVVLGQLYVTGIWTGLLVLVHRSRPDLDASDPVGSLRGYRKALEQLTRGTMILLACVNLSVLLAALRFWQIFHGSNDGALLALPAVLGLVAFAGLAVRAGRERARVTLRPVAAAADRDDDRFWKAGLVYVNRDDPAILVGARFGIGWTANFGNPTARLIVAGMVSLPLSLVILRITTGA